MSFGRSILRKLLVFACLFVGVSGAVCAQSRVQHIGDTDSSTYYGAYVTLETPPMFPGGEEALNEFIESNLRYPRTNIGGTVLVAFYVDTDGTILNPRVVRDVGRRCGKEALQLVKRMPKWIPGKLGGKVVKMEYTLPIHFDLQKNRGLFIYWQKPIIATDPLNPGSETEVDGWRAREW